jgi:Zn-finger nucleic acid-binding protein
MARIEERFSRAEFDRSTNVSALSAALESILLARMRAVKDAEREVDAIVKDLRALGHDLWSFDQSSDGAVWGGDHKAQPHPNRMVLRFCYPADGDLEVEVAYGPWPEQSPPLLCPTCRVPMRATHIAVQISGHGQVEGANVVGVFVLGEWPSVELAAGVRSARVQVGGFTCPRCMGIWLPEQGRVSAT